MQETIKVPCMAFTTHKQTFLYKKAELFQKKEGKERRKMYIEYFFPPKGITGGVIFLS